MATVDQISRYMSLRFPQSEALEVLANISSGLDYKNTSLESVTTVASERSKDAKPIKFDTEFPSFCFALATGVGKTRLMGAMIYYLWKVKGHRNFFILAPNITIYDKLRAELSTAHPKYMFVGLSDFPAPQVFDGDSYLRFRPEQIVLDNPANVFIFNISKIFAARTDTEFKFHKYNELLGNSFSAILREMGDLVVLMDESHRYRGEASLAAINHLKPALGLEFTATPKYKGNVVYSYTLAQAIGHFVKTPTVVTRTNLTTSDAEEIERIKLIDGMTRHEVKKGRLQEYCQAHNLPPVKPFVLISTKDTTHASQVRVSVESDAFCEGAYKGKVIEIHSGKTGAESDENVQRLLSVEHPTSTVEVVIHVNMLKEGWDVKNLCTIIPLRASVSEILTEQTIGRGLRLPFGELTGDVDLDALEIISHDRYAELIAAAKDSPLFKFRELTENDLRPVKTVPVAHKFVDMERVLDRISHTQPQLFISELTDEGKLNDVVRALVAEQVALQERLTTPSVAGTEATQIAAIAQESLFPSETAHPQVLDASKLEADLKERLRAYSKLAIDVPWIIAETSTEAKLQPFDVKVSIGPFELVDQRILRHDLASGAESLGDKVDVIDIDNPRAFLAGRLIDTVDEIDAHHDKDAILAIVDNYLEQITKPHGELGKIVHLYRDAIISDISQQIESHIQDETKVSLNVRAGFIKFRAYSKTILAKQGIVNYEDSVPRSDVRRYLFAGYRKSLYQQVAFDSTPEKDFATILEKDKAVIKWIRPPDGNLPIYYRGREYNPDFLVETADCKYMIEVKMARELYPVVNSEVRDKALAAMGWCEAASHFAGSKPWEYRLLPDHVIESGKELLFVIGQAIQVW